MKLTIILLTAGFLNVCAEGVAQNVSFSGKNATLNSVFVSVEKQTGFVFLYVGPVLKVAKPVTIAVNDMPLENFLKEVFKSQPLEYSVKGRSIIVVPKQSSANLPADETLDFLRNTLIDVRGRVINENGEPVEGVSVLVKGTDRGTITNAGGEFTLTGVDEHATLVFSSVNIESKEWKVNGQQTITISVKTAARQLGEVVVNKGYYTTSQRLNTGNVSRVETKTIERQPVSNPLQALQGRVPGMYIQQSTGIPGGSFSIKLRGQNSLRFNDGDGNGNGNHPLFIIDGVPVAAGPITPVGASPSSPLGLGANPLNNINTADIESIEILKDADATAIYGARGGNGVILISTKKGKAGKTKIELNAYAGVSKVPKFLDMMDTKQYLAMRREAYANDGLVPSANTSDNNGNNGKLYAVDLLIWDTTRYTDWQKVMIGGSAPVFNAQLSLSGGNTNTQFLVSGGYYKEGTVYPGDFSYTKGSGHLSITHISTDKRFSGSFTLTYSSDKNNLPANDITGDSYRTQPNAPVLYDSTGGLNWENNTWTNPLARMMQKYRYATDNLIANGTVSYEVVRNLKVKTVLGYNYITVNEYSKTPMISIAPASRRPQSRAAVFGTNKIKTWIIEPQVEYERPIGNAKLTVLVGGTFQQKFQEAAYIRGSQFANDELLDNIKAAPVVTVNNYTYTLYRYASVFGRIGLIWQEKYLLNLTGRRDGSSRFGPNRQFANFGAAGAAWLFSKEKFIEKALPFLSFGKLRASYGITGSDAIPDYRFLDTYTSTSVSFNGNAGLYPTRIANADYSWEVNKKLEAGIELGFLNDRVSLSASWYRNRSSNQLVQYALSIVTGQRGFQANLPATVQNTGWEFELNTTNIQSRNLTWTSSLNLSIPRNKLVSYPNIETSSYSSTYAVGRPLSSRLAYTYTGVDPVTGIYTFLDVNGDGIINTTYDQKWIKGIMQQYYGGIQNSVTYKGVQLEVLFQFVNQNTRNLFSTFSMPGAYINSDNQPVEVLARWQKPGDQTNIMRFSTLPANYPKQGLLRSSDAALVSNGSFIRLKNLSLSYTLPTGWIRKAGFSNIRLYVMGQNLLTLSKYSGLDAEQGLTTNLPPLRTITGGIQITL